MANLINLRHLGISCSISRSNLQEMPLQMGKLTNLRTLSEFVVSKSRGSEIGELGELLHLQGRLAIINLNNVIDACDATKANLKNKKHLDVVEMRWSSEFDDQRNESVEIDVLNELQPHTNLRCLVVSSYGGTSFTSWIGDPSFSNKTDLSLYDCRNCTSLPPLGLLPSLKNLSIEGMIGVNNVGVEFYGAGNVSVKPFPSLESLVIQGLSEWEEWFCPSSTDDDFEVFPRLLQLSLKNCPKLLRNLPGHLPSLETLVICDCPQLTVALSKLPLSCEIDLHNYKEVVLTNCVNFRICLDRIDFDADALISLLNGGRLERVADLEFKNSSLYRLKHPFQELRWSLLIELDLSTGYFKYSQLDRVLHINNTTLVALHIHHCQNLVSLSEVMMSSNMLLRDFCVSNCQELKSLPEGLHNLTKLKRMDINYCDSLVSFLGGGLPISLEPLSIVGCKNLNLMPLSEWGLHQLTSRRLLTLDGICPDLLSFRKRPRPASLTSSYFRDLPNLETLSSFPEWLLPLSLTSFSISGLPNLETLSSGIQNLNSLQKLQIENCPKIKFLPRAELLAGLSVLTIWDCPMLQERYKKGKGEDWPKIAHIPCINIMTTAAERVHDFVMSLLEEEAA